MLRPMILLFALFLTVQGQTTNVVRCLWSQGDLPLNVYIEGCINPPCILPQGQDVVVNIVFQAPRTMRTMRTRARAYLGNLPVGINYDLAENSHTCNFLENSYCPILNGEVIMYTLRMYIEEFFPVGTSANIEFRVEDENDEAVFCLRAAINIVSPLS